MVLRAVQDLKAVPVLAASSVGLLTGSLASLSATCGAFPGRVDPQYEDGMRLVPDYLNARAIGCPRKRRWSMRPVRGQ